MAQESVVFEGFAKIRSAPILSVEEVRERLSQANLLDYSDAIRCVIHPAIFSRVYARPYRVIFADASSYRHAETAIKQAGQDLTVFTLYGHYDFAIAGYISDERLDGILETLRPFCRVALPFTASRFYRHRHADVTPLDQGGLDEERLENLRKIAEGSAGAEIAADIRIELHRMGALLGYDWITKESKTRFVRGVVGIRMEERGGTLDSIDRLASTLLSIDSGSFIRTLVAGSGPLLPYALVMEVEAPDYHSLDEFTDLLIDMDLETRTIFVAKTLSEGAPSPRKDALRGAVPPHLSAIYEASIAQLPSGIVRAFDRASAERKYKILNRIQHVDRIVSGLPVGSSFAPTVRKIAADYATALIQGSTEKQLAAFQSLARSIEERVGNAVKQHCRDRWGASWADEARRVFQTKDLGESLTSIRSLWSVLNKLRQNGEFHTGDTEGAIPERELNFLVDTLEEIRPLRNRASHSTEEGFRRDLIVDEASFEVAVYDGILKALLAFGIVHHRFHGGLPVRRASTKLTEGLIDLRRALNETGSLTIERIAADVRHASGILPREIHATARIRLNAGAVRSIQDRVEEIQRNVLPLEERSGLLMASACDGARALLRRASETGLEATPPEMEPLLEIIRIASELAPGEPAQRNARLIARELAKQLLGRERGIPIDGPSS